MSRTFDEYLADIEKHGDPFPTPKSLLPKMRLRLGGAHGKFIYHKNNIFLNYGNSDAVDTIYIEDISENKKFTNDLNTKKFTLHLSDTTLYIDFDTDYYYTLLEFDTFEQFEYCQKNKKLTVALLNEDRSDIINQWTSDVNLL